VEKEKERNYFTTLIGSQSWSFITREIGVNNYSFLDKFGIIVFIDSTMGYEALARGYKTVAFPLRGKILQSKGHCFGWPLDLSDNGPFWSNIESIEEFHRVMNFIKNVSDNEWSRLMEKYVNSLITIDLGNDKFKTVMKQLNIY
jgi:surface carbohydrate biosynthesis protein